MACTSIGLGPLAVCCWLWHRAVRAREACSRAHARCSGSCNGSGMQANASILMACCIALWCERCECQAAHGGTATACQLSKHEPQLCCQAL